jgi:sulfur-oxidizing protein SoxY
MTADRLSAPATRRAVLGAVGLTTIAAVVPAAFATDEASLLRALFGTLPTLSDRVRLDMPSKFPSGYTVPLDLAIDSAMTDTEHPRAVHVIAPRNPLIRVAVFHFTPASGQARVSTRIRLAKPQNVVAVAEMSDGALLMASAWVEVESDGCA